MTYFSVIILLAAIIPSLMLCMAIYIFYAVGIYTLSKRCGLSKPYLAFIPIANYYQLGLLADQYERPVKIGKLRYALTPLGVLQLIASYSLSFYMSDISAGLFTNIPHMATMTEGDTQIFMQTYFKLFSITLVNFLFSLPVIILTYVALYKIYKMTNPVNAVPLLILSIFVPGSQAVILFILRNKPLILPNEQQTWHPDNL